MRLIDADRLIDDLKHDVVMDQDSLDYEELTDSNREKIQFDKDCKQNAIDLLQNAPIIEPERKTGHWIPCSERLPEKDGDYIVTFEKGYASDYSLDPIGIAPFEVDCEGFGFWQEQFDMHTLGSLGSDWVDINVIAWMPLPEPYREGE